MKREQKLMLLTGVLVVCVAGAVVISRMDFEEKMTGTETVIVDVDSDDITYLAWNYNGENVSFVKEDGQWNYESDSKMPVDQELLDEIAGNLSHITSDKKVEEVQSLGVYGLSNPSYTISIKTADEEYEIAVGDETFSDGEVYISNGDDYVYLTDAGLVDDISYALLDCVQWEDIPEMESVSEVKIQNQSTVDMVYKENSGYCYSDAYTYYLKDGDTYQCLDNENTEDVFTRLSDFFWEDCVDYYADESELESYGLADPAAVVSVTYKPAEDEDEADESDGIQTFQYEVGTADGAYYAKLKESDIVYSISQDVYDAAVNASYDELRPDEVILLDWDTVDSIEIETDGSVYKVELEKDGDDGYKYTFNNADIEFDDAAGQLPEILIADDSEELQDEEPVLANNKSELKLTFYRNTDEYSTVELEFYQYDGSYCISVLNGEEIHYTERTAVANLKEAVNSAILDSSKS